MYAEVANLKISGYSGLPLGSRATYPLRYFFARYYITSFLFFQLLSYTPANFFQNAQIPSELSSKGGNCNCSIPPEQVAGVDLLRHIVQHTVVPVGDDRLRLCLKSIQMLCSMMDSTADASK